MAYVSPTYTVDTRTNTTNLGDVQLNALKTSVIDGAYIATVSAPITLDPGALASGKLIVNYTANAAATLPTAALIIAALPEQLRKAGTCFSLRLKNASGGSLTAGLVTAAGITLTNSASGPGSDQSFERYFVLTSATTITVY